MLQGLEERQQGRHDLSLLITFTFTYGLLEMNVDPAVNSVVMRQLRTVVRSMITSGGSVVAMDDATIVWKPKTTDRSG